MTTYEPQTGMHTMAKEERGYGRSEEQQQMGTTGYSGVGSVGPGGYGRVILTIKSAHNLQDKAWIGKADPYVEVRLADATISTHHVPNAGESCTWDESFAFNNVAPDDVIEFHVYDKNRVRKDAFMGEGSLTLREVFEAGRMETRVPLSTRTAQDAGEIWISLRMEGEEGYGGQHKMGYEMGAAGEGYGRETGETTAYVEQPAATTTTTTTTAAVPASGTEAVCGQEYFTKTEDRPVVRERVTYLKEHRPVEKEFVVQTRATGVEREAAKRETEHMGTEERVVAEAAPKAPCE